MALNGSLSFVGLLAVGSQVQANVPHYYHWSEPQDRPAFMTYGAMAFAYVAVMLLILSSLYRGTMGAGKAVALGLSFTLLFFVSPCCITLMRGGESPDNRYVGGDILGMGPAGVGMSLAFLCGGGLLLHRILKPSISDPMPTRIEPRPNSKDHLADVSTEPDESKEAGDRQR